MKRVSGKNRLAIIALAVMIGVAGYMSFADAEKDKAAKDKNKDQVEVISYDEIAGDGEAVRSDSADASESTEKIAESGEVSTADGEVSENMELNGSEDEIGDAVLTSASAGVSSNMAAVKLTREQSRSKSRETLMDIIGDEALSDEAKKEAADTYVKLNDTIEMESDIETVLAAKGYADVVVTIGENTVDVTLGISELDEIDKAQIEDIVTRKTGYNISDVAISVMGSK